MEYGIYFIIESTGLVLNHFLVGRTSSLNWLLNLRSENFVSYLYVIFRVHC